MNEEKDLKQSWRNILESIKVSVSAANFKTWFMQTHLADLQKAGDRYIATVGCSSSFIKSTIESRYFGMLQDSLQKEVGGTCDILFIVKTEQKPAATSPETPLFASHDNAAALGESLAKANIRPAYNFENFAVSSSNQMAHAAAEAISHEPGKAYNPLFIWGGVGVGKTHLMSAVGYALLREDPETPVYLCTGEQFTNDIVEGIRNKSTQRVRAKYRKLKALLIDDIQFIAGKDSIQEEFFHTFNSLVGAGAQVILTSDKPPGEISRLEERLRSRFEAGLIVDIAPLDFELRSAITQIKSSERGLPLSAEQTALIAGNITSARQIEGFLVKLIAESKLKNIAITDELIKSLLGKGDEAVEAVKATPDDVMKAACKYFSLKKRDFVDSTRARRVALPRQILMYFLRTELNLPFQEIGAMIGGRDHTTVMHAVDKISSLASNSVEIREDIMGIKNSL